MKSLTVPLSIVNFIELFLSIIIGGLLQNLDLRHSEDDYPKVQVINSIAYGYLIINTITILSNICKEKISKNVRLIVAGSAFVMYVVCGILILVQLSMFTNERLGLTDEKRTLEEEFKLEKEFRLRIEFQLDEGLPLKEETQFEEKLEKIKTVSTKLILVSGICGRGLPAAIFSITLAAVYLVDISLCF